MSVAPVTIFETDVLIVGGGLAGCMAAIKASESGQSVIIAEKGNTMTSGCAGSGIDHMWAYIPEVHKPMGFSEDDMVENHIRAVARGFINKDLISLVINDSYARMLDLEQFGLKFRYEDSEQPGKFRVVHQFHSLPSAFNFDGRRVKMQLTKQCWERRIRIFNRVTVVDLLKSSDGHVAGALGLHTRSGRLYQIRAKAVVLSTGRVNRLARTQTGVWGNHRVPVNETGDGRAMAFRAGVPIINMEFLSPPRFSIGNFELNLGSPRNTVQPAGSIVDGDGNVIVPRTAFYDWEKLGDAPVDVDAAIRNQMEAGARSHPDYFRLIREGRGPFFLDLTGGTDEEIRYIEWSISHEGKGSLFLDHLKKQMNFDFRRDKLEWLPNTREMAGTASSGLVVDGNLETPLKGLFAAGDEVGGCPWSASPGAFTMGWRAGEMAAREAGRHQHQFDTGAEAAEALEKQIQEMNNAGPGQHWREVEIAMQNIVEYYAGNDRSEKMLQRGLTRLAELREVACLKAANPHESGRCLEVLSLLENSEMIMRASLERRESRRVPFGFVRADYPEANDEEFFAFLSQRRNGGDVQFGKIDLPR